MADAIIDGEVESIAEAPELCECGRPKNHRGRHAKAVLKEQEKGSSVRGSHWGDDDVKKLELAAESLLLGGTAALEARTGVAGATFEPQEAHEIAKPSARIFCRHVRIPKAKQGDVSDAIGIAAVMGGYFMRLYAAARMNRDGSANVAINGSINRTDDPLAQYRTRA